MQNLSAPDLHSPEASFHSAREDVESNDDDDNNNNDNSDNNNDEENVGRAQQQDGEMSKFSSQERATTIANCSQVHLFPDDPANGSGGRCTANTDSCRGLDSNSGAPGQAIEAASANKPLGRSRLQVRQSLSMRRQQAVEIEVAGAAAAAATDSLTSVRDDSMEREAEGSKKNDKDNANKSGDVPLQMSLGLEIRDRVSEMMNRNNEYCCGHVNNDDALEDADSNSNSPNVILPMDGANYNVDDEHKLCHGPICSRSSESATAATEAMAVTTERQTSQTGLLGANCDKEKVNSDSDESTTSVTAPVMIKIDSSAISSPDKTRNNNNNTCSVWWPRSRLDPTKSLMSEINNLLVAPVAPPPSRAGSEPDSDQELGRCHKLEKKPHLYSNDGSRRHELYRSSSLHHLSIAKQSTSAAAAAIIRAKPGTGFDPSISSASELVLAVKQPPNHQVEAGSLSDSSYKLTKYRPKDSLSSPYDDKIKLKDRFKQWKQSNRLITNIHENPFNMHLECLNRLSELEKQNANRVTSRSEEPTSSTPNRLAEPKSSQDDTSATLVSHQIEQHPDQQQQQQPQQEQKREEGPQHHLSQYANHLTYLYKRNQEIMDSNADFRALLYNIICCLLVQDEHVLGTPSVGKMLDVIRTHLESASRVYSEASSLLISTNSLNTSIQLKLANSGEDQQHQQHYQQQLNGSDVGRTCYGPVNSSTDSLSCTTSCSTSSSRNLAHLSRVDLSTPTVDQSCTTTLPRFVGEKPSTDRFDGGGAYRTRNPKPADFRRVSSVSYNDQQLINDLCDRGGRSGSAQGIVSARSGQRSSSLTSGEHGQGEDWAPSPWAYQELCERPNSSGLGQAANGSSGNNYYSNSGGSQTQYTSQSSLDQMMVSATMNSNCCQTDISANTHQCHHTELMNDSGNGTVYEFQTASDFGPAGGVRRTSTGDTGARIALSASATNFCTDTIGGGGGVGTITRPGGTNFRRLSDFKPQQQPSYMSTDEYLSAYNSNCNPASFYDDECSSALQKCDFNSCQLGPEGQAQQEPTTGESSSCLSAPAAVDVASRRAELEWTLNRLINIELKHTWLTSQDTLRRAIRKIGVPNEVRDKVWLILIDRMIGTKYDVKTILEEARKTIAGELDSEATAPPPPPLDEETQSILKQIELDVNRTMPGHRLFDHGAEGGVKLRLILVAYSIHVNRAIAYCQGFNFIVALLLSVFEGDEDKALSGFICIVDHIFPSKYYFDHYLTGARADQFLLADFICDQLIKNPTMAERKMIEAVTSSITLNWFISLFHGAVPTLTRLTILDHFMLEGVRALFRFTMAILYLAFQVTPPSSCEIFQTIRNTAKDMYDIKLLLSIVSQIKLPKDSYFAIRRSFYMVQSSFNSDQFYMQTLSSDASRIMVANKPLSVQQMPDTKEPSLCLMSSSASPFVATNSGSTGTGLSFMTINSLCQSSKTALKQQQAFQKPRIRISADRTKVCIQSLGKLGRSHLRIIDTNSRSNERSLMSPLRNCLVVGITNCGKSLVFARQSSKRNYRSFREQDLNFHIHELHTEIFDGFFLEESDGLLIIITHSGEIFKIDTSKQCSGYGAKTTTANKTGSAASGASNYNSPDDCTETLMLRDSSSLGEHEKIKLRLCTMDCLTKLLWIYLECEDLSAGAQLPMAGKPRQSDRHDTATATLGLRGSRRFKHNNPFAAEFRDDQDSRDEDRRNSTDQTGTTTNDSRLSGPTNKSHQAQQQQHRFKCQVAPGLKPSYSGKIIIVDIVTFDIFSAFAVHPNFGEIISLRASLVAFCQLLNPASNQFSTRIVQIGPTGRYEQLLSFSDVVDYMISVPESYKRKYMEQSSGVAAVGKSSGSDSCRNGGLGAGQRYSTLRRLLNHSMSFHQQLQSSTSGDSRANSEHCSDDSSRDNGGGTLTRYYRSLMKSYSSAVDSGIKRQVSMDNSSMDNNGSSLEAVDLSDCNTSAKLSKSGEDRNKSRASKYSHNNAHKLIQDAALRSIVASSFGNFSELSETNYVPVNMAFIFRNGKIALFEFTESYAIHTRESQLDRYDYSKVIDVTKNGDDFIVTILTVFDKLIKVVI